MARARNIKPKFFLNDDLAAIHPLGRLLFIGLWTIADYRGCVEFRPARIKAQLLPYDACDVEELARALDKSGFISIYSVQGVQHLKILKFDLHQNPHKNERDAGTDLPDIDQKDIEINGLENIEINPDKNGSPPASSLFPLSSSPIPLHRDAEAEAYEAGMLALELQEKPIPAPERRKDDRVEPDFLRAWERYPKRDGGNSRQEALNAWRARIREGATADEMIAGIDRYKAHMEARGKIGTEFVSMMSSFIGKSKKYLGDWPAAVPTAPRANGRPSINAIGVAPGADDDIFNQMRTGFDK